MYSTTVQIKGQNILIWQNSDLSHFSKCYHRVIQNDGLFFNQNNPLNLSKISVKSNPYRYCSRRVLRKWSLDPAEVPLAERWSRLKGFRWWFNLLSFIIIVEIPWDEDLHKSDVITWWEETFLPGCVEVERPTIVSWSSVALVPSESWWSDEASFSFLIFTCRLRDWQHWQRRCPWREDTIRGGRCIHNSLALKKEWLVFW